VNHARPARDPEGFGWACIHREEYPLREHDPRRIRERGSERSTSAVRGWLRHELALSRKFTMKILASILLLGLAACSTSGVRHANYPEAQSIVEGVAARHSDIVRLTIHAVPSRGKSSRVIASNVAAKLDDGSDPEDIQAMETKQPVTLMEGDHLDYTAPVIDESGKAIAAVGVTVKGGSEAEMRTSAESIARELSSALVAAGKPLW